MGIGSIYKQLHFDGDDSGDYNLYITGEGTFNAPERDAEMIAIPGRNGAYVLDHGRFQNIEVTYPAGCFGTDSEDFATTIANIRAWFCSKRGYVRLEDDYNPDEYRLAVYKSGLDVSPAMLKAGQFDLVFECMPQRFLKSGEVAQAMSAVDTISNPTEFASRPMLQITGYGETDINGAPIVINSVPIGQVVCMTSQNGLKPGLGGSGVLFSFVPDYAALNTGDDVRIDLGGKIALPFSSAWEPQTISNFTQTGGFFTTPVIGAQQVDVPFKNSGSPFTFQLGTAANATASFDVQARNHFITADLTFSLDLTIDTDGVLTFTILATSTTPNVVEKAGIQIMGVTGNSTKSALGSPVYIDLDIGEAWKEEGGAKVSVNNAVSLPAELPELHPGTNAIEHDVTITDLKIVPRWWTV